jgi:hypothetical protein
MTPAVPHAAEVSNPAVLSSTVKSTEKCVFGLELKIYSGKNIKPRLLFQCLLFLVLGISGFWQEFHAVIHFMNEDEEKRDSCLFFYAFIKCLLSLLP